MLICDPRFKCISMRQLARVRFSESAVHFYARSWGTRQIVSICKYTYSQIGLGHFDGGMAISIDRIEARGKAPLEAEGAFR